MAGEFEERFRLITDAISDVFWISERAAKRILYVSPAYERIWGRSIAELYANPHAFRDTLHPADRERAIDDSKPFETEYRIVRPDGEVRWIRDRGAPVFRDGVVEYHVGIATDITETKRVTTEHAELVERLRLISWATNDGLWEWNIEKGEVWWSEQSYALYGLPPTVAAGYEAWVATIHPEDRERVVTRFAQAVESCETSYADDYRILRPDQTTLEVTDRACIIRDEAGKAVRIVGAMMDNSARRTLERQLRHAQKMEAIGQLAGGVAHDFNNILQAAILELALLQNMRDLPPQAVVRTSELRTIVERAANLTRQLLVFSRREAMRPQRIDINSRVVDVVRLLRRVIGESVALNFELASGILAANADPSMVDQILINLAVNARDAMPDGGTLTIETSLRSRRGQRYVCISVRDNGVGIPAADLPRIFEPFFTTKESGRGTGLGLATVHGIVEQHGGSVEVASELDRGSTFNVYFPALDSDQVEPSSPPPLKLKHGNETILVVEDDTPVRIALRALLEDSGYRVVEAERGASALASWDELHGKIDLVLTDVVMPGGMSGGELAERLVARAPRIPIIFVTGYNPDVVRTDKHQLLNKPIDPDRLLRTVRETLDRALVEN
jgi:two-component system, cell cycle sensor histidine kinase and response regulator CckA